MECDEEYQEERGIPAHGKSVKYIFLSTYIQCIYMHPFFPVNITIPQSGVGPGVSTDSALHLTSPASC